MTTEEQLAGERAAGRKEAKFWLACSAVAALALLIVRRPGGEFWPHVFDLFHVLLSAGIAVVALRLSRRLSVGSPSPAWVPFAKAMFVVVLLGGGLELAQLFGAGSSSWSDLGLDASGGACALAFIGARERLGVLSRPVARRLVLVGSCVALCAVLYPSGSKVWRVLRRAYAFPVLCEFSSEDLSFLLLNGGATIAPVAVTDSTGDWRVTARFPSGGYPGVELAPPFGDWSLYKELVIPVFSSEARPFSLAVRVNDRVHSNVFGDRFDQELLVEPGVNEFRFGLSAMASLPSGRRMNLNDAEAIILFAPDLPEPHSVLLGPWRLEGEVGL